MQSTLKRVSALLFGIVGAFVATAYLFSMYIVSGSIELLHWDKAVISNHNVLFFANLMTVAGFGGYLSSRVKRKDLKVAILVVTYILVFAIGSITQHSLPFRF